jgi:NADPH-dependent ferric siderophore reductase
MITVEAPGRPGTRAPGRLSRALLRLLMKRATIVAADRLADGFRLITLEGPALRGIRWTPGQKLQVAMGSAFVARTYTPIEWDSVAGRTRILGYEHGDGPGSAWVRDVEPGDECDLFGPRASLDVGGMAGPLALFGDETSIGLACALARGDGPRSIHCHFEVGDVTIAGQVLAGLAIGDAALVERHDDDEHIAQLEAALPALAAAGASFVLTGRAGTIKRLRQGLKQLAVPTARLVTKAYWAPGKTGLD